MRRIFLLCVLSALSGGVVAFGWRGLPLGGAYSSAQETPAAPGQWTPPVAAAPAAAPAIESLTPDEQVNVFVYQQTNRSVVNINTKGLSGDRFLMFELISEGEGSGMVIDRLGHVLTNFHVVDGAREIHVTLFDGKTYDARLVGGDADTDVAVLRIEAPPESLFPVTFGSSTSLLVGQRVFAIGNPFGLERTLTTGIISSLDRSLPTKRGRRSLKSIIQIDAAINPGNSGGPLLDSHARMIGMNTAIASKTGSSAGVAFAIPVNTIARIVPQLIQNGHVRRPETGIARVYQTERGLLILTLVPGGPAERAGLQGPKLEKHEKRQGPFVTTYQTVNVSTADMIVGVDGRPIKTADDFLDAVESKQPGDQVTIAVIRGGQQRDVPLRLEAAQ
ncbi:MAG: trypsin-like peptidase domain-containing protein [Planctomycetaceae bacterium]|nr:trypsin-like peptidase domain-containing protein [Planctomycetaceae bacterium]